MYSGSFQSSQSLETEPELLSSSSIIALVWGAAAVIALIPPLPPFWAMLYCLPATVAGLSSCSLIISCFSFAVRGLFFNLYSQINCLSMEVSIYSIHISQMIRFHVFLCFHNLIGLSFSQNLSYIFPIIRLLAQHGKLNPFCKVSWSYLYPASKIISIILSPTDDS